MMKSVLPVLWGFSLCWWYWAEHIPGSQSSKNKSKYHRCTVILKS